MSKARTLADFISDGSEFADGTISVAEVSGAAPLASPTFTGTASGTFSGPLTGNVTGNVTGDLTGDVTGNVAGNLTGNVTGDVAGDIDLSAIAATISDTAVDIFVYDTRKDSDGGAWRKRTQHTSWYNETLNTSTRGSRKEFPSVAVIVAESNQVTIYDGDDPSLPMWMVFNTGSNHHIGGSANLSGVYMLNAQMCVVISNNGLFREDFIQDRNDNYWSGGRQIRTNPVLDRNTTNSYTQDTSINIVASEVNDVAMTVLPNAPIDATTGLPVPTIAVATDGGVSVIKDDGTVVDITNSSAYDRSISTGFTKDNKLFVAQHSNSAGTHGWLYVLDIPSSDKDITVNTRDGSLSWFDTRHPLSFNQDFWINLHPSIGGNGDAIQETVALPDQELVVTADHGITKLAEDRPNGTSALGAYITSSYNTGWMNGDIKLATLSDTDDTNVTGSELVTNGTFDTDTSGWTALSSATLSVDTNRLKMTNSGTTLGGAYQAISVTVGKTYTVHVGSHEYGTTNGKYFKIGNSAAGAEYLNTGNASSYTHTFTPTQSTVYLTFQTNNNVSGATSFVDNISVRLAEEDRSVNGNGLQVFGTVTKSAVATGADLVAYSGFNTVNNLIQPHNDDLDFGTGDFAVFAWMQYGTATQTNIIDYAEYGSATGRFEFYLDSNKVIRVAVGSTYTSLGTASASGWSLFGVVRQNGVIKTYENGKEMGTSTNQAGSIGGSNHKLWVGTNYLGGGSGGGHKLSLLRISRTVPSPEQIRKIYEDEKVLFQDGAQATLYGSSDAVTALAYDDSTELLHVGTSAGRSVFQGLRRVDNTTTAVGAAISASNGLVADE